MVSPFSLNFLATILTLVRSSNDLLQRGGHPPPRSHPPRPKPRPHPCERAPTWRVWHPGVPSRSRCTFFPALHGSSAQQRSDRFTCVLVTVRIFRRRVPGPFQLCFSRVFVAVWIIRRTAKLRHGPRPVVRAVPHRQRPAQRWRSLASVHPNDRSRSNCAPGAPGVIVFESLM
jgi:hypothetical protein